MVDAMGGSVEYKNNKYGPLYRSWSVSPFESNSGISTSKRTNGQESIRASPVVTGAALSCGLGLVG